MAQPSGAPQMERKVCTTKTSTSVTDLSLMSRKQRELRGSSLVESAAAPTSEKAKALLEKMGWTEGTGLGKRRDGMATHLKAKRRPDQAGLGVEKQAAEHQAATQDWWKDSLGDALARIGKKKKKKKFTDEELFEATGGARFGMRAAPTKNLAKWRRTESETDQGGGRSADVETKTTDPLKVEKKKKREKSESGEEEPRRKKAKKEKKAKKKKKRNPDDSN